MLVNTSWGRRVLQRSQRFSSSSPSKRGASIKKYVREATWEGSHGRERVALHDQLLGLKIVQLKHQPAQQLPDPAVAATVLVVVVVAALSATALEALFGALLEAGLREGLVELRKPAVAQGKREREEGKAAAMQAAQLSN